MELKDYTTEELRAELKKRNAEEKAKKESILRCRMCEHWGEVNYLGDYVEHSYGALDLVDSLRQRTENIIDATAHQS